MDERCSYCHDGTERENPQGLHEIGNPYRPCPRCGRTYFDAAYEEEAVHLYRMKPEKPRFPFAPVIVLCLAILPVNVEIFRQMLEGVSFYWIRLIVFWGISAFVIFKVYKGLHPWIFRKKYYRKFEESKIPVFSGETFVSDEFSQSLQRMSREEYLYDLIAHGVEVPEFFFRRIGRTVDTERVEELKAERQAHFEGRARKEQLRKVRADLAYYEDCLSMDQESRQFAAMAKAGGLSAGEFRTRCETEARKLRKKLTESEQTEV